MTSCRTSGVLLLILLGNTLAWDGCQSRFDWRCGDTCIDQNTECNCGGTIFNHRAEMWCCQDSPCNGKGEFKYDSWFGEEDEEGRVIGAVCTGTALNLTQACNRTCNYHEEDEDRNWSSEERERYWRRNWDAVLRSNVPWNGLHRSYVACQVANLTTTQCIMETEERDGKVDCRDKGDELPEIGNPSPLDLDNIMTPCLSGIYGNFRGFQCSGGTFELFNNCLALHQWCNPSSPFTCDELVGKTATGKTIDHQMCANQTFWETKGCTYEQDTHRRSGPCTQDLTKMFKCCPRCPSFGGSWAGEC